MRRSNSASYTLFPERSPSTAISSRAGGRVPATDRAVGQLGLDPAGDAEGAEADRADRRAHLDQHDRPIGDEAEPLRASSWLVGARLAIVVAGSRARGAGALASRTVGRRRPAPADAGAGAVGRDRRPAGSQRRRPAALDLGQDGVDRAGGLVAAQDAAEAVALLFDHTHPHAQRPARRAASRRTPAAPARRSALRTTTRRDRPLRVGRASGTRSVGRCGRSGTRGGPSRGCSRSPGCSVSRRRIAGSTKRRGGASSNRDAPAGCGRRPGIGLP